MGVGVGKQSREVARLPGTPTPPHTPPTLADEHRRLAACQPTQRPALGQAHSGLAGYPMAAHRGPTKPGLSKPVSRARRGVERRRRGPDLLEGESCTALWTHGKP